MGRLAQPGRLSLTSGPNLDFVVEITQLAQTDAESYVIYLQTQGNAPAAAERWWNELLAALWSLEYAPHRCALVREERLRTKGVRQLIHHSHRIVFQVDEPRGTVLILRVYHTARRELRDDS